MNEEKEYEQEFFSIQETPEQVREKMAKRLQELRSKKAGMHEEEVQRKKEKQFRESYIFQ